MALSKQLVPIVFAGGIDTKTDPKQVVAGKLLVLENATFVSPRQIKKAPGYVQLPTGILGNVISSITQGEGLMSYEGELLLASANRLYSFSAASNSWADKGSLLSVSVDGYLVNRDAIADGAADCAVYPTATGGLALFAWEETDLTGTYVNYCVVDTGTQQIVVPSKRTPLVAGLATGKSPRCFALGNNLVLTWAGGVGSQVLSALALPIISPQSAGTVVTVASNMVAGIYDACVNIAEPPFQGYPPGNTLYFAYNRSGSGLIGIAYMLYNFTSAATGISSIDEDCSGGISIVPAANDTYSITHASTLNMLNTVVRGTGGSFAVVYAENNLENTSNVWNIACTFDGLKTTAFYTIKGTPTNFSKIRTCSRTGSGSGTTPKTLVGLYLASKPFINNGITYMLAGYASGGVGIQNTYFLIDSNGVAQAKILGNQAGGFPTTHGVPQVIQQADGSWLLATMVQDLLTSGVSVAAQNLTTTGGASPLASTSLFSLAGVQAIELTLFNKGISYSRAEVGNTLHITGGFLSMYDGSTVVESGFHLWPEALTISAPTGPGAATGAYSYVGVYEWTDAQGNRHQSAPSQAVQQVLVNDNPIDGTHQNTITFPCLRLTQKQNVVLVVYRTQLNGTQYFRVTDVLLPNLNPTNPDTNTISITDGVDDAHLAAGQNLYTFGGSVENVAPPACSAIATGSNRLWVLSSVNPLQVWYSKQVVPGTPAQFSDLFVMNMDPRGGPVTAIATMDDYEVFFKESSIFIVAGDGPDDTGQQNAFQTPKLVTTDSGCIDPRSVVLYPGGLMYKSQKGIYHLNRGLAAEYVGAEVEAYNDRAVVSANLVADRNQVRFNLDDGTQLVFDYFMKQWSTRPLFGLIDAAIREEQYFYLDKAGVVSAENPFSFAIAGRPYALKLKTSWLQVAGVNGFQRVYGLMLLGDWKSPHTLRISVAYDFNDTPTQITDVLAEAYDPGFWGDGFTWGDGPPPPWNGIVGVGSNYYTSPGGITGPVAPADVSAATAAGYVPATAAAAAAAFANGTSLSSGSYVWGGSYPLYQLRVNFDRQKCTAVQVTVEDIQVGVLDSLGNPALPGEGYSIGNMCFIVGVKEGWNKVGAERVSPAVSP